MLWSFRIKQAYILLVLANIAVFTLIDTKSITKIPFDYLALILLSVSLFSFGKLNRYLIVLFLFVMISLFATYMSRANSITDRELLFLLQLTIFFIYVFLVSDEMLDNFQRKYNDLLIIILVLSAVWNSIYVVYYYFTQPYFGKINLLYSVKNNHHLYGYIIAMQYFVLSCLNYRFSTIFIFLSPVIVTLIGARNAILISIFTICNKKYLSILLFPILIYILFTADLTQYRSLFFSLSDGSAIGRIIKWKLAIEGVTFTNLFIGQQQLKTIYWDNLFVSLLVNVGFFFTLLIYFRIYRLLSGMKFVLIIVIFSTFITEFYLVPAGLFWGLILPSILLRKRA